MLSNPDYWSIVAKGIDLEDEKIGLFVQHKHSRGIAREAILRSLLVNHTRHPFVVSTGFCYDRTPEEPSKQCDVLVFDPREGLPYYRLDEFVVAPPEATRLAIEVKSFLDRVEFDTLAAARRTFPRPMFGFAFDGVSFETLCEYLAAEITAEAPYGERRGIDVMPECICVHRRNLLGIRATAWSPSTSNQCYLVIDFSKVQNPSPGSATGHFLFTCDDLLREQWIHDGYVHGLFNMMHPAAARAVIYPDGRIE
ncbi:MAG TPA: DUF6602 domain-containing protein, partial [Urbifossiella sp.]|nr:DUF6602 domain-containing protein [Urbifossiella sp.]